MSNIETKEKRGRMILLATILASGMSFLASTTVSIALPAIQSAFNASINNIQWILNSYVLALAVLILVSGSLGDHFGRKKIFLYGIAVFTVGSLFSALAQSVQQLIAFQALQGVGAAMMVPGSLAIINVCFVEKERGKAIGLWAGVSGAMAAIGPLAAGWLLDVFSWPSVFWLNVPIGFLVFFIAKRHAPESYNTEARNIDWFGALLVAVSLLSLSYALIQGSVHGWGDQRIVLSFTAALLALIFFIFVEKTVAEPLVPLGIFKNPLVLGANAATFMLYFALSGTIIFLALNLQQIQGYSPFETGLALLPPVTIIALFSGWAGSLADRIGPRMQMIVGPLVVAMGMTYLAFSGTNASYFTNFFPGLVLFGAGMAFTIAPLTKSALEVEENFSGVASGVNNAVSRVASLMAVAVLGAVMLAFFGSNISDRVEGLPIVSEQKEIILNQRDKLGGISIPESFNSFSQKHIRSAIEESFAEGFKWVMAINAILAFTAAAISFFEIHNPVDIEYRKRREEVK
ncbi:MAG: MFS transporter [Candidatus Spechtbacterales bacterium]